MDDYNICPPNPENCLFQEHSYVALFCTGAEAQQLLSSQGRNIEYGEQCNHEQLQPFPWHSIVLIVNYMM